MAVPGRKAVKDTASGESFEFVCGPCIIDGINLQAAGYCAGCGEYLCVSCYTCHLKPLPCRHHVLFDTNTMPKDKQLTNVRDICTERCPTHFGKLLEFFCPVHVHLSCNVCMTISHRSCEDVAFIADEVNDIYTSDGYVSFKMKLAGIEASIVENRKIDKEHESEAETIQNLAMDNVKAFRKDINAFFDKLEAATETSVKHLNNQNIASTKQVFERCDSLDAKLQSLVANINSKQSLNQKCNLFVAMKRAKGSVESYEEEAKAISTDNKIQRYVFQPEKEILNILKTAADFGQLTIFEVKTKQNAKEVIDENAVSKPNRKEMGTKENKLQQSLQSTPSNQDCVICMDLVHDPITLACGHMFCKECIEAQFTHKKACPTCGTICAITGILFHSSLCFTKVFDETAVSKPNRKNKTLQQSLQSISTNQDCVICMDLVHDPITLACGHVFCKECIEAQFKHKKACPTCGRICGVITGDQPDGTMKSCHIYRSCAGYKACDSIEIMYCFPRGKQTINHPSPGKWYEGITRKCYLPDNTEGQLILETLRIAFNRRLVFTIGNSRTTGQEGVITWNGIHHKTNMTSHER